MWTQRTGGGLWNCRLSGKNKRPAVGAHRWAGGKRQLEGSPIYSAMKGWAADSALTPVYPSQLVWPFDPDPTSTSSFHYRYFSHVYQSYHTEVVQMFASPLFFVTYHKVLLLMPVPCRHAMEKELCSPGETFLWFTAQYNKLSIFLCPPAMEIARSQSSKSTAQPSGLWISLNTGYSSLSCMWIFSLVQFQIN